MRYDARPAFISSMKALMLLTDVGFAIYWTITLFHLLPPAVLYRDYTDPMLVAWNWSFFPLDIAVSATGLASLWLAHRRRPVWRTYAVISLVLTSVSGLQAISFWMISGDFNLGWWLPNAFLLIYPLIFIPWLVRTSASEHG